MGRCGVARFLGAVGVRGLLAARDAALDAAFRQP